MKEEASTNHHRAFQKDIEIINSGESYEIFVGAAATAIVSIAGTISSVVIGSGSSGSGYSAVPTVTIQTPVGAEGGTGVGATPFVGIGTTARAEATATVTNGVVSGITVTSPGLAYTSATPPQVLITPPTYIREENTIDAYTGDYGIISGIGTTSFTNSSTNVAITTGISFDLWIPADSPLRNEKITSPDPISVSGLQTGHYFMVRNSTGIAPSGFTGGLTTLDAAGNYVGVGTEALDGIYQVGHYVGITTVGYGSDIQRSLLRVYVDVLDWKGLNKFVGVANTFWGGNVGFGSNLTGLGGTYRNVTNTYVGEYSWGLLQLSDRMKSVNYTVTTTNGVAGIKTGPQIKRKSALKAANYVV